MRVHIRVRGSTHQPTWGGAFKEGLKKHGINATISPTWDPRADMIVMWSTHHQKEIAQARAEGKRVCILERGYLGNRLEYTSVSFGGGLNNRGEFYSTSEADGSRLAKLGIRYTPAEFGTGRILLIGQKAGDMSHRHINIQAWYESVRKALPGRIVKFRGHPLDRNTVGVPALEEDLKACEYVVTFNSNTGVDALVYGRPVVTCDEGAMAWPVTSHDPNSPVIQDSSQWLNELAWKQWNMQEMQSGECWAAQKLP